MPINSTSNRIARNLSYALLSNHPGLIFTSATCSTLLPTNNLLANFPPTQRVQGLEHLSLLEQLDLGNNLISKAVSARALSFNRSLKLLWLGGNPLARHPRYRPTLTCLLPHVRSIDSRGMPPSSDSEQRRWTAGVLTGEEGGGEGCHDSGVGSGGGFERGGGGNSVSVSREWQAEQDERRSKEWRQVRQINRYLN